VGGNYRVVALLDDGGTKVLQAASAHANDWHDFESLADAKDYCDALLDKGWRWPRAVALAVESCDTEATRFYLRAI
jgi:hypothetical protein